MFQLGSIPTAIVLSCAIATVSTASVQVPFRSQSHTEGYKFDALLHLPGISPYFDAIGAGLSHAPPLNCEVTAASYLIRHAAIYANDKDWEDYMLPFLTKLNTTASGKKRKGWEGPLAFFDKWKNPIDNPDKQMEQITPQGAKDAEAVGKHLLSRYPKLVPTTKKIYADTKARTQDTAAALIKAFKQKIKIVKLDSSRSSFQAQNPHKACKAFSKAPGDEEQGIFMAKYTKPIVARLQQFSPIELNETDIMGMQQLCGYESAITGKKSKICNVFTDDEWMSYEYAWDLKYSYMVGHGNPLSPYLGFPWLNTTEQLMSRFVKARRNPNDPESIETNLDDQRFFLSFTHREVPPFIATALGLFNSSNEFAEEFPTDRINWSRAWKMAELIPFLGHIGIETLTCNTVSKDPKDNKDYIRVIANSAPRPIPRCSEGPGASCELEKFVGIVKKGMDIYGDFDGICGNREDEKKEL